MTLKDVLTYQQAAEVLNVSRERVGQLVAEKKIETVELSPGRRLLLKSSVEELAQARRDAAAKRFRIHV